MLEVRGVTKAYNDVIALRDVNLEIAPGEVLGLVGSNGAGKTTLVSIIAGLRKADAGSVRVGGVEIADDLPRAQAAIGLAPQELGVYLQLTVQRNLRFFGKLAGLVGASLAARVAEAADALDLEDLLDRTPQELSGGEKRRLHTAIALLNRPPLLLLDEPTAGVDVRTRARLLQTVARLADDGVAVCYATHYLHEIETIGASVAILEDGSIVASGRVAEVVAAAGRAIVEMRVVGSVPPSLPVVADGEADGEVVVRITPEDPVAAVPQVLEAVSDVGGQVKSLEVMQPSLESAYLSLTGRRVDPEPGAERL